MVTAVDTSTDFKYRIVCAQVSGSSFLFRRYLPYLYSHIRVCNIKRLQSQFLPNLPTCLTSKPVSTQRQEAWLARGYSVASCCSEIMLIRVHSHQALTKRPMASMSKATRRSNTTSSSLTTSLTLPRPIWPIATRNGDDAWL